MEKILAGVERPASYIGGEYNSTVKDWQAARARMAFCFPDTYEIGMSHLGLRILYEAINREQGLLCERCFYPRQDMRQQLLANSLPLITLESGRQLADFDVIGFTLQYELSYTNVLDMLHLAKLPLLAAERGEGLPLIIAGGPCAYNPEPLAEFIDLFCIGEGEEQLPALLRLIAQMKQQGCNKQQLLQEAAKLPGIYAPALYQAAYDEEGHFAALKAQAGAPNSIRKAIVSNFDAAPFPMAPILPHTQVVHDRIMLEIMRGCGRGCRFCQAGIIYRPVREKDPALLLEQAKQNTAASGYEDIGLISLSSADYSQIEPLMRSLTAAHGCNGVGVSLPSLRVDAFSVGLAAQAGEVRKSGLTFAPEAGSQRLRDIINKGVTEEDIIAAISAAFAQGYSTLKLYFMIGLPGETFEDIKGIADLCQRLIPLYRRLRPAYVKKPLKISLGVASFVPKAHTPFQWYGQDSVELLRQKQDYLLQLIRPLKQVNLRYHDTTTSLLEAAFARGDRRLGAVLLTAWQNGCRADGWSEHFKPDIWRQAFAAHNLNMEQYACRVYAEHDALPWQHIESGVSAAWLWKEYQKALQAALTADCRNAACHGCGACAALGQSVKLAGPAKESAIGDGTPTLQPQGTVDTVGCGFHAAPCSTAKPAKDSAVGDVTPTLQLPKTADTVGCGFHAAPCSTVKSAKDSAVGDGTPTLQPQGTDGNKWRLRLAVEGSARWLSHLELLSAMEKALRRAALPVAFSQGFNPHMLISWGPAHPVGLSGNSEYLDINFAAQPPSQWPLALNAVLPPGLNVLAVMPIERGTPALMAAIDRADYALELSGDFDTAAADANIAALLASDSYVLIRETPKGRKELDIRPALLALTRQGNTLHYSCRLGEAATPKAPELARIIAPWAAPGQLRRLAMYIKGEEPIKIMENVECKM